MNVFKKWKERREQKRKLRELSAFASGFRTMDTMADSGLLVWNMKQRQLFIDSSLAIVMMRNVESWTNFINNVFLWQYSKECERAWADYFLKEELAAVRKYKSEHKGRVVTRQDVERIREARRQEILQSDISQPKVKGFEFFIVAPPDLIHDPAVESVESVAVSQQQSATNPVGRLISVGHYDPETDRSVTDVLRRADKVMYENKRVRKASLKA